MGYEVRGLFADCGSPLRCPACAGENVHLAWSETEQHGEVVRVDPEGVGFTQRPPRGRGSVISVGCWCEEGHTFLVLSLYGAAGRFVYECDLERCTTSAGVLDWLCQVAGKMWATDRVLAGLARAMNDLLHPQATMCSFGKGRPAVNVKTLLMPGKGRVA